MAVDVDRQAELLTPARRRFAILPTALFFFVGYDYGAMAGTIELLREKMSLTLLQAEFVVGALTAVASIGATVAGVVGDVLGRRAAFRLALWAFIVAAVAQFLAFEFWSWMAARLCAGVATGLGMTSALVYAAELAPAASRGRCLGMAEVFQNAGLLAGFAAAFVQNYYQTQCDALWLLFIVAPAVLMMPFSYGGMPESPRWLAMNGHVVSATKALTVLHCLHSPTQITSLLLPYTRQAGIPDTDLASQAALQAAKSRAIRASRRAWKEILLPSSWLSFRRLLLPPFGILAFQQLVFTDALIYFTPLAFSAVRVHQPLQAIFISVIVLSFIKLLFSSIAVLVIDTVGRKNLLRISSLGVTCCLFATAGFFIIAEINTSANDNLLLIHIPLNFSRRDFPSTFPHLAITFACLAIAFYSIGLGPVPWTLAPELLPFRLRSKAMGSAISINRTVFGCVALVFVKLAKDMTPAGLLFMFAAFSFLASMFTICVPDNTDGATLEEISALHDAQPSTASQGQRQEQEQNGKEELT